MTELFYTILNMSISASILVLVVLLLRLVFRKAPKWVTVLLWGLVAVRLICPFALETPFSLMPRTDWVTADTSFSEDDLYLDSVPVDRIPVDETLWNDVYKDITVQYDLIEPQVQINRGVSTEFILNCIWLAGEGAMLVYMLVSYILVMRRIRGAKQFRDNIYTSEAVASPFVFGLIRPHIYLPENMDAVSMSYVIAHEESHLRRFDHFWKPIGFLLLTVHWFNPLIWIGYILLCRDIEMACDERVVRGMNAEERADYSEALLECSINRKMITACPLAFGEVDAKARIKSVLSYKKPAFWIVVVAVIACVVTAVCFLTNPASLDEDLKIFIDCRIAEHHQSPYAAEHACVLDWELIGKEKSGEEITLYMWVLYEEYSLVDEKLQLKTGAHIPTAITAKKVNGGYRLVEYWEPGEGADYSKDIRSKVPWYLYGKMTHSEWYIDQQKEKCVRLAEEYFANEGNRVESTPLEKRNLTLEDVIELSAKGSDLTWEDFAQFESIETGSGLYIRVYEIDDTFELWIGGSSPIGTPMYIYLTLADDLDTRIDIRDGGVEEFIAAHSEGFLVKMKFSGIDVIPTPYLDWATDWMEGGWVSVDGYNAEDILPTIKDTAPVQFEDGSSFDYEIECGENVTVSHVSVYNESYERLSNNATSDFLRELPAGDYFVNITIEVQGEYIASEDQYETAAYNCIFGLAKVLSDMPDEDNTIYNSISSTMADEAISSALKQHYLDDDPTGLLHGLGYHILKTEHISGTPLFGTNEHFERVIYYLAVYHQKYNLMDGGQNAYYYLNAVDGRLDPIILTFKIDDDNGYVLEEYWEPRDGAYYEEDLKKNFPDDALERFQKADSFLDDLKKQCEDDILEIVGGLIPLN